MNITKLSLVALVFISALVLLPRLAFACPNITGTYILSADSESRSLIRYEQTGCTTLANDIVFQQLDPKTSQIVYETPALVITSVIDGSDDCSKQSPCFATYQAFDRYILKREITPRMRASDANLPGCRFTESRLLLNASGDLVEQALPDTCPVNRLTGHAIPAVRIYKRLQ